MLFRSRLIPETDDGVVVVLEGSGQRKRVVLERSPLRRSIFEGSAGRLPIGSYEIVLSQPALGENPLGVSFTVVAPIGEMTRTALNQSEMQQAAERSRGKFYTLAEMAKSFNELPAGDLVPVATLPPIPLWNTWQMFVLFFALLLAEWLLRKRFGML